MLKFLKVDIGDEDNPVRTVVEAENMDALLDAEAAQYRTDDRLEPCSGEEIAECVSRDENSVQWEPGDGGAYTIARYCPDTPAGREDQELWLRDMGF